MYAVFLSEVLKHINMEENVQAALIKSCYILYEWVTTQVDSEQHSRWCTCHRSSSNTLLCFFSFWWRCLLWSFLCWRATSSDQRPITRTSSFPRTRRMWRWTKCKLHTFHSDCRVKVNWLLGKSSGLRLRAFLAKGHFNTWQKVINGKWVWLSRCRLLAQSFSALPLSECFPPTPEWEMVQPELFLACQHSAVEKVLATQDWWMTCLTSWATAVHLLLP